MPADVTGISMYRENTRTFEFQPGPIFTDILLADEINRAPAKTQAALLEAMAERQVTVDGKSRPLDAAFTVLATQNPVEHEGTFPLPEAQLDRFLLKIVISYPSLAAELGMLELHEQGFDPEQQQKHDPLPSTVSAEQVAELRTLADRVKIAPEVRGCLAARDGRPDACRASGRGDRGARLRHARRREGARPVGTPPPGHRGSRGRGRRPWRGRRAGRAPVAHPDACLMGRFSGWLDARRPFWVVFPTRRLGVVVAVTAFLWLVPGTAGRIAIATAIAATLIAVGVDFVLLPGRRHVRARRSVPESLGLGDREDMVLELESHWRRPFHAAITHEMPPTLVVEDPQPITLSAGGVMQVPMPFTPMKRGRVRLGDVALRVTSTLGLLARIIRLPLDTETVVVPSLANVRRFRLLAMQHRLQDVGVRALRRRGEGRSFAGLREYVPGDDPRNIDWKSTARHERMMLREFTIERSQTVMTLVDCGRAMTQMAGDFARMEHVLSAAMLLTDVAAVSGDQVGALAFDDSVRAFVPPQRGRAALGAVRQALSGVTASLAEPDYAAAFRMLALRQRRRALIVFFTDVIDARASRSLVAYLGRAVVRHAVVVVAIRNDALLGAAHVARPTAQGLYLAAAAEELVQEREEALARMRRAGVTVLDVSATQMATAVVNRYLEVKARGLL
jgi:uncharacterized protein (DUF58 family)